MGGKKKERLNGRINRTLCIVLVYFSLEGYLGYNPYHLGCVNMFGDIARYAGAILFVFIQYYYTVWNTVTVHEGTTMIFLRRGNGWVIFLTVIFSNFRLYNIYFGLVHISLYWWLALYDFCSVFAVQEFMVCHCSLLPPPSPKI